MRRVLITGASSGIGAQLAQDYLATGWEVVGCGRRREQLAEIDGLVPLVFDITDRDQVLAAAAQLEQEPAFDLIILNAGDCQYMDNPWQFDDQLFEQIIRTNVISVGYCLHAFLPLLVPNGRVAIMSSSAAYLPLPRAEAYGSSKAAVRYLAKTLQMTLAKTPDQRSIGVSVICPGFVKTPLTDKNTFRMPILVTVKEASRRIRRGLAEGQPEIHFPKRFTMTMRLMRLLPDEMWQSLVKNMIVPPGEGRL